MHFHDFHLDGYEVTQQGRAIVLHLSKPSADGERVDSRIAFSDVVLYDFTHTGGAILTDIREEPVTSLVRERASDIAAWHARSGVHLWCDSAEKYSADLQHGGYRAWRIESAIGFDGFVIAREIAGTVSAG